MFAGVALALSDLPVALAEALAGRVHERGGEREVRFLLAAEQRVLPVWLGGKLQLARWGAGRRRGGKWPCAPWVRLDTLRRGWGGGEVVPVVIPASLALDGGVWFAVREGVHGVAARDEAGRPVVYVVVEPATHYYQVMTRSEWMPCLVEELV